MVNFQPDTFVAVYDNFEPADLAIRALVALLGGAIGAVAVEKLAAAMAAVANIAKKAGDLEIGLSEK